MRPQIAGVKPVALEYQSVALENHSGASVGQCKALETQREASERGKQRQVKDNCSSFGHWPCQGHCQKILF